MAKGAQPKFVEVTAPTSDELVRLYKAAIQYRLRHPGQGIHLRKHGDAFFVWIADEMVEPGSENKNSATGLPARRNSKRVLPRKSGEPKDEAVARPAREKVVAGAS
jgi:hypothetical protein